MSKFRLFAPLAVAFGVACGAGGASAGALVGGAGFTAVNAVGGIGGNERCGVGTVASGGVTCGGGGTFGGQESIASILSREVGGLTRVQDFDGSVPGAPAAGSAHTLDQLWSTNGQLANVRATARYLGASVETLGIIQGTTPVASNGDIAGAGFQALLPLLGSPNQLQTSAAVAGVTSDIRSITASTVQFTADEAFRFAILTNISLALGDANWTSLQGRGDGTGGDPQAGDHMIAFQFDRDPNAFFLFFDDQPSGSTDFDFNDTVFEVHFVEPIPEPATLSLFAVGMLCLGMMLRSRRAGKTM